MFGWFKKKVSADPATAKQVAYAKRLGMDVSTLTKAEASQVISAAEAQNTVARDNRVKARDAKRLKKFGPELIAAEQQWEQFAAGHGYMLAIYQKGKDIIVDVLQVSMAEITDSGKLQLIVAAPKLVKDKEIGDSLEWEREFTLPITALKHYEALKDEPDMFDLVTYQQTVKRGMKLAARL